MSLPHITTMTIGDATTVAQLHAASWKATYRGILSDAYLDHRADNDRVTHWKKRVADIGDTSFGLIARDEDDLPVGFAFVDVNEDTTFGNLLDNLHVLPTLKGKGYGRALISAVARTLRERDAMKSLYLWVYEENRGARAFYERMQGVPAERKSVITLDDRTAWQWRYHWPDAAVLF